MTQAHPSAEKPAPDKIPSRSPHRQAGWYRLLAAVAALLIVLLIGVTCTDVIGRYMLNRPFGGAYELTQILLGALVFVAMPLTTADGGHVEVDLALHLLPRKVQRLLGRLAGLVSAVAFAYFTWRLVLIALDQLHEGTRSASLALPMAPLAFLAAVSCAFSAVIMLLPRREP